MTEKCTKPVPTMPKKPETRRKVNGYIYKELVDGMSFAMREMWELDANYWQERNPAEAQRTHGLIMSELRTVEDYLRQTQDILNNGK